MSSNRKLCFQQLAFRTAVCRTAGPFSDVDHTFLTPPICQYNPLKIFKKTYENKQLEMTEYKNLIYLPLPPSATGKHSHDRVYLRDHAGRKPQEKDLTVHTEGAPEPKSKR